MKPNSLQGLLQLLFIGGTYLVARAGVNASVRSMGFPFLPPGHFMFSLWVARYGLWLLGIPAVWILGAVVLGTDGISEGAGGLPLWINRIGRALTVLAGIACAQVLLSCCCIVLLRYS